MIDQSPIVYFRRHCSPHTTKIDQISATLCYGVEVSAAHKMSSSSSKRKRALLDEAGSSPKKVAFARPVSGSINVSVLTDSDQWGPVIGKHSGCKVLLEALALY